MLYQHDMHYAKFYQLPHIVNPIEIGISLFGRDMGIRDSYFATAAELQSRGKFISTIDDMIIGGDAVNLSTLVPDLTVPLSAEFVFDIPVTDEIIISPIMSVESDNLVESDFDFDFDADIGTFLNNSYMGNNTLTSLLQNATSFLETITSLELELNATGKEIPPTLNGFFDVVNQIDDLADHLLLYIDMVEQGMCAKMIASI